MRERNFSSCCLIIFCAYMVLYAASTSLPGLLQSLFGYDALNAGLVMSPAGFFAVVAMPVVGFVLEGDGRPVGDHRRPLIMAAGNYWMSQLTCRSARAKSSGLEWCWSLDFRYALPR